MSKEKDAAVARIRVLYAEIDTLHEHICHYSAMGYDNAECTENLYKAVDSAWAELETLSALVGLPIVDLDAILMAQG
jgi:formylmethanofuran dehydrogenase subunit E